MIRIEDARGERVPLVFDSPHSGTDYPDDFGYAIDHDILRRAEDTYVHELYDHVTAQGAPLLHALFPRSYIDTNRTLDDLDPELIDGPWPHGLTPGDKTARGIGLIWRRIRALGEIYDRKLDVGEVKRRIENCWRPYHQALEKLIRETHARFGFCYHINCHSMPAFGDETTFDGPKARADFVLGDRDGMTCAPAFTTFAMERLQSLGFGVALNDPYKGAELVRAYADPAGDIHSLQIEINRALYMNEETLERNGNYPALKAALQSFTADLADYAKRANARSGKSC